MQIKYTIDAFASLTSLINFIESKNTQGAGLRWLDRYEEFLTKELINLKRLSLCKNAVFHKLNLHCIYFNEWLIAISIHEDFILVEALLHKSRIRD
ncbi:MAG TPA: hypothetical protein VIJ95_13685 [Hanamia sp.]